jgi:small subunit ribosomal protein S16
LVKIRLRRIGAKKQPSYRLVVADSRAPRDGAFIAVIGHYNPLTNPETLVIDEEKASVWLKQGAQPTDTAARLLAKAGIIEEPADRKEKMKAGAPDKPKASKKKAKAAAEKAKAEVPEAKAEEETKAEVAEEPKAEATEASEVAAETKAEAAEEPEAAVEKPKAKAEVPEPKAEVAAETKAEAAEEPEAAVEEPKAETAAETSEEHS